MRACRSLLAAAAIVAAAASPLTGAEAGQVHDTHVGGVFMLKLPGNPTGGYRWRLNVEQSRGLDLVDVQQVGWIMAPEAPSLFFRQNSTLNVAVRGKAAGEATLAFDYYRTWGSRAGVRTTLVLVRIKPAEIARK